MVMIWSFPGEENRQSNPFTATLLSELRALGHQTASPGWPARLLGHCDIVHLHWPQKVVQESLARSLRSIVLWLGFLYSQKLRGARIVWTIHNVASHEAVRPGLERWWMNRLLTLVDGVHALSEISLRQAIAAYPAIAGKHALVAPHWIYADAYPPPPTAGRHGRDAIAFLGDLKAYKGLDVLLSALERAEPDGRRYIVHGKPADDLDMPILRRRLQALQQRGWRIEFVLARLSDQEMVNRLEETGLLVLPYLSGENSGLAVLAAERGTPLLASALPAFAPLLAELPPPRAMSIAAPLDHRQIVQAFESARAIAGKTAPDFLKRRAPGRIVREISNYYLFLLDRGPPSPAR